MSNIVTIAYTTEGATDKRFLESIIRKTFEEVAFQCEGEISVFDPVYIKFDKGNGFAKGVANISIKALTIGINVLCIHVDADDINDQSVFNNKIIPALKAVEMLPENIACCNLVAIIPVTMSEAWMLADKELLKEELNTSKSNEELNLIKNPEAVADPKAAIQDALQLAQAHLPRRRNRITIGELYQPIGQKIQLNKLEELVSFKKFRISVQEAFRKLNYLQ